MVLESGMHGGHLGEGVLRSGGPVRIGHRDFHREPVQLREEAVGHGQDAQRILVALLVDPGLGLGEQVADLLRHLQGAGILADFEAAGHEAETVGLLPVSHHGLVLQPARGIDGAAGARVVPRIRPGIGSIVRGCVRRFIVS